MLTKPTFLDPENPEPKVFNSMTTDVAPEQTSIEKGVASPEVIPPTPILVFLKTEEILKTLKSFEYNMFNMIVHITKDLSDFSLRTNTDLMAHSNKLREIKKEIVDVKKEVGVVKKEVTKKQPDVANVNPVVTQLTTTPITPVSTTTTTQPTPAPVTTTTQPTPAPVTTTTQPTPAPVTTPPPPTATASSQLAFTFPPFAPPVVPPPPVTAKPTTTRASRTTNASILNEIKDKLDLLTTTVDTNHKDLISYIDSTFNVNTKPNTTNNDDVLLALTNIEDILKASNTKNDLNHGDLIESLYEIFERVLDILSKVVSIEQTVDAILLNGAGTAGADRPDVFDLGQSLPDEVDDLTESIDKLADTTDKKKKKSGGLGGLWEFLLKNVGGAAGALLVGGYLNHILKSKNWELFSKAIGLPDNWKDLVLNTAEIAKKIMASFQDAMPITKLINGPSLILAGALTRNWGWMATGAALVAVDAAANVKKHPKDPVTAVVGSAVANVVNSLFPWGIPFFGKVDEELLTTALQTEEKKTYEKWVKTNPPKPNPVARPKTNPLASTEETAKIEKDQKKWDTENKVWIEKAQEESDKLFEVFWKKELKIKQDKTINDVKNFFGLGKDNKAQIEAGKPEEDNPSLKLLKNFSGLLNPFNIKGQETTTSSLVKPNTNLVEVLGQNDSEISKSQLINNEVFLAQQRLLNDNPNYTFSEKWEENARKWFEKHPNKNYLDFVKSLHASVEQQNRSVDLIAMMQTEQDNINKELVASRNGIDQSPPSTGDTINTYTLGGSNVVQARKDVGYLGDNYAYLNRLVREGSLGFA